MAKLIAEETKIRSVQEEIKKVYIAANVAGGMANNFSMAVMSLRTRIPIYAFHATYATCLSYGHVMYAIMAVSPWFSRICDFAANSG